MVMSRIIATAGLLALPALMLTAAAPAEAGIVCKNGYQIVNGSPIATPYCQDALVGHVARQHGMKVSDAAIMNNPNTKREVCQFVGRDIRLTTACVDANSQGRRGF
jgi:hypothetical protein